MEPTPFFVFGLRGSVYAIQVDCVVETIWLPALTAIEEAPSHIAGIFNFRGQVVPVMDLAKRFGYGTHAFKITDKVLVIRRGQRWMGIIVDIVYDVQQISPDDVDEIPDYGLVEKDVTRFLDCVMKHGSQLIMRVNLDELLSLPELDLTTSSEGDGSEQTFFVGASNEERAILDTRASDLARSQEDDDLVDRVPLALVRIGEESFGLELSTVIAFTELEEVTPVPGTPSEILGVVNFRGEVVTLLDVRNHLGLPPNDSRESPKMVVVQIMDGLVGMDVDEVLDVTYVSEREVIAAHVDSGSERSILRKGTVPFDGRVVGILDLDALLQEEMWSSGDEG
jgi:purine-binding chemotaxis protein CheW